MRRFLQAIFVVVALMSNGVRSSAADSAQALLDKNKAFAGWVFGDPSMQGLRLSGTFGDRNIVDLRRGAIWRRTISDPKAGITYDVGFTGKRFWYTDFNGFTIPLLSKGMVGYQVAYQVVMNQGIPLLSGTLHGSATVDGTSTEIVRVQPPDGDVIDAYIEPSTGRLARAVIDPDGNDTKIDVLGYADLDGKKIISSWHISGPKVVMDKVEHAKIDDSDFHPPAPKSQWTFAAPAPIPITVTKYRIVIRAKVNGVDGNFILDSGAGGIAFNPDFATRAKVKNIAPATSFGLTGERKGSVGRVDTIAVGQNVLHNVLVTNNVNVQSRWSSYDGLLGFDFLAGAIVDIDIAKQQMTMFDPAKYAVSAPGPALLVDLVSGTPSVPVTLNGRVKGNFTFDTGAPMMVVASDDLYGPPRGVEMRLEFYARLGGAGGDASSNSEPANCGRITSIEIGTIKYGNVPTCFGDYKIFGHNGGIIGLDFLKQFDLTFDYPDSALYLTPLGK